MISIRPEAPTDRKAIYRVHRTAFGQPQEPELVDALRRAGAASVSLVAVHRTENENEQEPTEDVVGHILFSPVSVVDGDRTVGSGLGLAPMAVLPGIQHQGIGSKLVHAGIEACREADVAFLVVLGHEHFYPRFGFRPARPQGLLCGWPVPDPVWMALPLRSDALDGVAGHVRYHAAFDAL